MFKLLFAATALAAAPVAAALAVPAALPAPYYYSSFESSEETRAQISVHYASGVYSGPVAVNDPFLKLATGGAPTPFISVAAHGGADYVYAEGGGSVEYFFAIDGPSPVVVPLRAHVVITASVRENVRANGSAGGSVDIQTDQGSVTRSAAAHLGSDSPVPDAAVDEWVPFSATAGSGYQDDITLTGGASGGSSLLAAITSKVFVDPYVVIDPVWAAAHPGYSLSFSAGIGNTPSAGGVPEPAAWGLLLAGFGVVGMAARRRRAVVVA